MKKTIFFILAISAVALVILAQGQPPAQGQPESASELLFRSVGYLGTFVAVIALTAAAIYGSFKRQALAEATTLNQVRRERILELEAELVRKELRIKDLEKQTDELTKRNFRLQGSEGNQ